MVKAIAQRKLSVDGAAGPIHRLKKEMPEAKRLKLPEIGFNLRIDQLQFVAALLHQLRSGLWADANPIQTRWSLDRSIGFDSNLKIASVQRGNQARIQLQQRLSAGADHESLSQHRVSGPLLFDGSR